MTLHADWTTTFFDDTYACTELEPLSASSTARTTEVLTSMLGLQRGDAVLDLGCGLGRHSVELARRGFKRVTGLDFNPRYLERARSQAVAAQVEVTFIQGDMRALSFEAAFDAVISCHNSMFYWDDQTHLSILMGVRQILRPGGQLYLECPNRDAYVAGEALNAHRGLRGMARIRTFLGGLKRGRRPSVRITGRVDGLRGELCGTRVTLGPDGSLQERSYRSRLYTPSELRTLLEGAGFEVQHILGHGGSPYHLLTPQLVVVACRRKDQVPDA